jgi:hypothetical protein
VTSSATITDILAGAPHPWLDFTVHRPGVWTRAFRQARQTPSAGIMVFEDINYGGHLGNDAVLSLVHEARVRFLKQQGYTENNIEGAGIIMADAISASSLPKTGSPRPAGRTAISLHAGKSPQAPSEGVTVRAHLSENECEAFCHQDVPFLAGRGTSIRKSIFLSSSGSWKAPKYRKRAEGEGTER